MTTERDKDARDFDDGMEVSRLRAEVERLRAGLLKIATGGAQYPIGEAASLLFLDAPTPEPSAWRFEFGEPEKLAQTVYERASLNDLACKHCGQGVMGHEPLSARCLTLRTGAAP